MNVTLKHRAATEADLDLLAEWNHQLIKDEGHRNKMSTAQLRKRMQVWLASGEYQAIIFSFGEETVAYSLHKEEEEEIYLRQLFVRRDRRNEGIGQTAVGILKSKIWPRKRLTVEVLSKNESVINFYRRAGYHDYCLKMEILPGHE